MEISPDFKTLVLRLSERGVTCKLAGGCVRDYLLGRPHHDFDVAFSGATSSDLVAIFREFDLEHNS